MADIPTVVLTYDPPGPQFAISEDCKMPVISVTAALQNAVPDPKFPLVYKWKASLKFSDAGCLHSLNRVITHPDIEQTSPSNKFNIQFAQVRGGDLTVSVTVQGGTVNVSTTSADLKVVGTNPSIGTLSTSLDVPKNSGFRKLMRLESGLKQFLSPTCPLFSGDNKGGVGICQITSPAPTDDEVWSWKANVAAGWKLYQDKEKAARAYPKTYQNSAEFIALVKAYNDQRTAAAAAPATGSSSPAAGAPTPAVAVAAVGAPAPAAGSPTTAAAATLKPLEITLPAYTDDQLERDTLRGFNGYAGQLHEYRPKVDKNGILVVTVDATSTKGTAEWEAISAQDRIAYYDKINLPENKRGDPNYVDDVEKRATF